MSSPIIEWRGIAPPFGVVTTQSLIGSGYNGAIPMGTSSVVVTLRLYNNFSAANGITDATSCVLAAYDDAINQGNATSPAAKNKYLHVKVLDYNGIVTNADTQYYAIGGTTKHPIPTNGGTIGGATPNYVTVSLKIMAPTNAVQGSVSQGVWLEYNTTS